MVTPNINHKNHVSKTDGNAISVNTLTQMIISLTRLTQLTIDLTRFDISCILDSLLPNMKRFFCSNYHVHVQLFWRFNKNQNYFLSFFLPDNFRAQNYIERLRYKNVNVPTIFIEIENVLHSLLSLFFSSICTF